MQSDVLLTSSRRNRTPDVGSRYGILREITRTAIILHILISPTTTYNNENPIKIANAVCQAAYNSFSYSKSIPRETFFYLLRLLDTLLLRRLTIQPKKDKCKPPNQCDTNARNPGPRSANSIASSIFIVRKVAYGDLPLLVHTGKEGTLVVYAEVENAVLIRRHKGLGVHGRFRSLLNHVQGETVEWRKHGEFELQGVARWGSEWDPFIVGPLGESNGVCL